MHARRDWGATNGAGVAEPVPQNARRPPPLPAHSPCITLPLARPECSLDLARCVAPAALCSPPACLRHSPPLLLEPNSHRTLCRGAEEQARTDCLSPHRPPPDIYAGPVRYAVHFVLCVLPIYMRYIHRILHGFICASRPCSLPCQSHTQSCHNPVFQNACAWMHCIPVSSSHARSETGPAAHTDTEANVWVAAAA